MMYDKPVFEGYDLNQYEVFTTMKGDSLGEIVGNGMSVAHAHGWEVADADTGFYACRMYPRAKRRSPNLCIGVRASTDDWENYALRSIEVFFATPADHWERRKDETNFVRQTLTEFGGDIDNQFLAFLCDPQRGVAEPLFGYQVQSTGDVVNGKQAVGVNATPLGRMPPVLADGVADFLFQSGLPVLKSENYVALADHGYHFHRDKMASSFTWAEDRNLYPRAMSNAFGSRLAIEESPVSSAFGPDAEPKTERTFFTKIGIMPYECDPRDGIEPSHLEHIDGFAKQHLGGFDDGVWVVEYACAMPLEIRPPRPLTKEEKQEPYTFHPFKNIKRISQLSGVPRKITSRIW